MSQIIHTTFDCPACDTVNDIEPVKPRPFQPTVKSFTCSECKSRFMIRFKKVGGEHSVEKEFLKVRWSEEGERLFIEKQRANDKSNQKTPANEPDNQGAKHAND